MNASRIVFFVALAAAAAACSDTTPAPSGDLPGDRGGVVANDDSGTEPTPKEAGAADARPESGSGTDAEAGAVDGG